MQNSFSDFEYRHRQTRRDRFLGEMQTCTPWAERIATLEPFYPKRGQRGGRQPMDLERMMRIYISPRTVLAYPMKV